MDGSDFSDGRLEGSEGSGEVRKRGGRDFDEKRV